MLTTSSGGAQVGETEYRFSYLMRGRVGRALGKWTWGQCSPLIPPEDLDALISLARRDGTLVLQPTE